MLEPALAVADAVLSGLGPPSAAETDADLARMEDLLRDSGLDWTVVRPPRLTDKPLTGAYRTAYGQNLRRGSFISRADVAHLMLDVLARPQSINQTLGVAY